MARSNDVHWFVPASITCGLLGGILVVVGHHVYYASLSGTSTEGDLAMAGYQISNQQLNSAVGTAFAFIVRAFLLFSISVAYVQVLWQAVKHTRKPNKINELDDMFSVLTDFFALRRASIWQRYPLLFLIALVGWVLPIAFVFPPAALSVQVVPLRTWALVNVPNFDFTSLRYVAGMPPASYSSFDTDYLYNGPSIEVQKVATAVAAGGAILPITPPTANSSWSLDFYGPSISCGVMEKTVQDQVMDNFVDWFKNKADPNEFYDCQTAYEYLAWTSNNANPTLLNTTNTTPVSFISTMDATPVPFINTTAGNSTIFSTGYPLGPLSPLYIVTLPHMLEISHGDSGYGVSDCQFDKYSSEQNLENFWQCNLYNASYRVRFNYETGTQIIKMDVDRREAVQTTGGVYGSFSSTDNCIGLTAIKEDPNIISGPECTFDPDLLRNLSYTAIFDAFRRIMVGSVSIDLNLHPVTNTNVISTTLINTPELSFLQDRINGGLGSMSLQTTFHGLTHTSRDESLLSPQTFHINKSLPNAMEEMFHNITISLISSQVLQPNASSEFAPPKVNVTKTVYKPIYTYSTTQLWVSYSIAVLLSGFASIRGLLALRSNGASYSCNFSSIYRVAYSAALSTIVQPDDTDGADPLPKYLGNAYLCLKGAKFRFDAKQRMKNADNYDRHKAYEGTESERHSCLSVDDMSLFGDISIYQPIGKTFSASVSCEEHIDSVHRI